MIKNTSMRSSYSKNNYGDVFFTLVEAFRPIKVVELGILDGYSTKFIANGLKYNFERNRYGPTKPTFDAYDLFEDYEFKHGDMKKVQKTLETEGVADYVTLHKGDAFKVWKEHEDKSIWLLHIDLSNDGDIVKRILELWNHKMVHCGIIACEGGSIERDNVEWMVKYKKKPIHAELLRNEIVNQNTVWGVYRKYPSLTVMLKKWENI